MFHFILELPEPEIPLFYVCSDCGSDSVSADGTGTWNVERQDWDFEIAGSTRPFYCESCSDEIRDLEPLTEEEYLKKKLKGEL